MQDSRRKINFDFPEIYCLDFVHPKYAFSTVVTFVFKFLILQVQNLRKKCAFGVILVRIFPYLDWIRTRLTPNTENFHAVRIYMFLCFDKTSLFGKILVRENPYSGIFYAGNIKIFLDYFTVHKTQDRQMILSQAFRICVTAPPYHIKYLIKRTYWIPKQNHAINPHRRVVAIYLILYESKLYLQGTTKPVTLRCSVKNQFWKILENGKKNTYGWVFY